MGSIVAPAVGDLIEVPDLELFLPSEPKLVLPGPSVAACEPVVPRPVPKGSVRVCSEPEQFGRFPVRTELTVLPADEPKSRTLGWSTRETIGIGVVNSRAVGRMGLNSEEILLELKGPAGGVIRIIKPSWTLNEEVHCYVERGRVGAGGESYKTRLFIHAKGGLRGDWTKPMDEQGDAGAVAMKYAGVMAQPDGLARQLAIHAQVRDLPLWEELIVAAHDLYVVSGIMYR